MIIQSLMRTNDEIKHLLSESGHNPESFRIVILGATWQTQRVIEEHIKRELLALGMKSINDTRRDWTKGFLLDGIKIDLI